MKCVDQHGQQCKQCIDVWLMCCGVEGANQKESDAAAGRERRSEHMGPVYIVQGHKKRPHFKFSKCKTFHNCCTQPQNKNVLDAKTSAHLYCIYIEPNVLSQLSVLSYPNTINITGQSGHRGSEVLEAQFDYYLRYNLCVISRVHLSSLCFMHLKRIIQITGQVNSSGFSGLTSHSLPGTVSNPAGVLYKEGRGGRVRLQTHRRELH